MARQFSVLMVLRNTPNARVRELLGHLGHGDLPISWDQLTVRDVEPVHAALKTLSAARYDAIEGICRTVFDLACETGVSAILEGGASLDDAALLAGFAGLPEDAGLYDKAMWALIHHPQAVELAGLIFQVENLSWWRRRDDLPRQEPDPSPGTLRRLGEELSALLQLEQGRGRNCTVEAFARTRTRYYFAYPDDYVQNVVAHDDGGLLTPRTFRRTFSLVFALDPAEGALELYAAKLSPRLKQRVEEIFASVVFGVKISAWVKPTYDLSGLAARGHSLPTDPQDRIEVSIRQLRLRLRGSQDLITLHADPGRGPQGIYDLIDEVIDRERVPPAALEVTMTTFCFEFLDAPRGRGRTLTFEVAKPNTCSLRNQRQDRIDLAMKYLRQWGIYGRRPDGGLAAAG